MKDIYYNFIVLRSSFTMHLQTCGVSCGVTMLRVYDEDDEEHAP